MIINSTIHMIWYACLVEHNSHYY